MTRQTAFLARFTQNLSYVVLSLPGIKTVDLLIRVFYTVIMPRKSKNITGKKYGKLTAVSLHHKEKGNHYWLCSCACGNEKVIRKSGLLKGGIPMCDNCRRLIMPKEREEERKLYSIWCQMKTRCYNKNSYKYSTHGAKGILVCDDWLESFEHFVYAMGPRPQGARLRRICIDGDFSAENCLWASKEEFALLS